MCAGQMATRACSIVVAIYRSEIARAVRYRGTVPGQAGIGANCLGLAPGGERAKSLV